jgi:hypothetical protein
MKAPLIRSADIEADSLTPTKIWCLSVTELEDFVKETRSYTKTSYEDMREQMQDPDVVWIFHNGHSFDKPAMERILGCKLEGKLIDTLALSWYLFPKNNRHGLAWWGEELGIKKPEIDDWEGLSLEEYCHRCQEDVKIQTKLWKMMWKFFMALYGDEAASWRAIEHLSFKLECAALQEKSKWKLNVPEAERLWNMFSDMFEEAKETLETNMPMVPKYVTKTRPKKPFKKNGDLSATGIKWQVLTDEHGVDFDDLNAEITIVNKYEDPNAGSTKQLKEWLTDLGWTPETFDFKRDKETGDVRKIPQIKVKDTGELCKSIKRLIPENPELKYLEDMSIVKHRKGVVNGFLVNVDDKGYVKALVQGFTNTLRFKHKVCLNLPSGRKPYGLEIRGLLMARSEETELCGSDMCSLEDRTKQHFMWDYDPEYVKDMMAPDFDPHIDMALTAGMINTAEANWYKAYDKETATDADKKEHSRLAAIRHPAKSTNYAATYGAGGDTIARAAGCSMEDGARLHAAYWERNVALVKIATSQIIKEKTFRGKKLKWLWNPVAKMWIWLKNEKDVFSTLNQSTGTYCFDMWIKEVLKRRRQLTGQFHDEGIWELKVGNREGMTKILKDSIQAVNDELKLNRALDVDVDFDRTYAGIH